MKTWFWCLAVMVECLFVVVGTAIADTLFYDFVRAESQFVVTGGFAGVNEIYAIEGSLGLDIDLAADTASFSSVDAVLYGRESFDGSSINDVLNMELLTGTVVNATTIHFTGREPQGLEVLLEVDLGDDSLQLTGGNVPMCCDFFSYDLSATAVAVTTILGDVNLDGEVNALDVNPFVALVLSGEFQRAADCNLDDHVNGLDVTPFVDAVLGGGGVEVVPEPSTLPLTTLVLLSLLCWRRAGW